MPAPMIYGEKCLSTKFVKFSAFRLSDATSASASLITTTDNLHMAKSPTAATGELSANAVNNASILIDLQW